MIEFTCHACNAKLQMDEAQAGKKVQCPQCQKVQSVPVPGTVHHGVVCNNCRNEIDADASMAGTMQRCPYCGSMVVVPGQAEGGGCFGLVSLFVALLTTSLLCVACLVRG